MNDQNKSTVMLLSIYINLEKSDVKKMAVEQEICFLEINGFTLQFLTYFSKCSMSVQKNEAKNYTINSFNGFKACSILLYNYTWKLKA